MHANWHKIITMKNILLLVLLIGLFSGDGLFAQENLADMNIREIHVVNGMGWGFPTGKTKEVLSPKYSTSLGLDIGLKDKRYFLYPSLDFLAFKYDQKIPDPTTTYMIEHGNSFFYMLNLTAGRYHRLGKWGIYGFGGPAVGMVTEPRAYLKDNNTITLKNNYYFTPGLRLGAGSEYQLGNVYLFAEASYLYNFRRTQGRPTGVLVMYGGLKTNVTRVADRVIEIISNP